MGDTLCEPFFEYFVKRSAVIENSMRGMRRDEGGWQAGGRGGHGGGMAGRMHGRDEEGWQGGGMGAMRSMRGLSHGRDEREEAWKG